MFIELEDARIFVDVVGARLHPDGPVMRERPTLVVLHGGPGYDHSTLRPYFDRFSDTYQVLYLDHRGCGRSSGAPDTWRLERWADDVADLLDLLGIEDPLVFGQSFGGMVAMKFAVRHPSRARRLILSSTAARFRLDATVAMARQLGGERAAEVARNFFETPTLQGYETYGKVCLPLYSQKPAEGAAEFTARAIARPEVTVHFFREEMMQMDLRPEIAGITCPTLVTAGALDPVTPQVCSEEIAEAIGANARLRVFDGCGHGAHRDDPEGAEAVMREFLSAR